jgi:pimeloyl-ACP methyl ester carboxylesterase
MTAAALAKALALGAAGLGAFLYGYLYFNQDAMVFPGSMMGLKSPPGLADQYADVEALEIDTPDGITLEGWIINQGEGAPLIVYFGGNAEEVSYNIPELRVRFPGWSAAFFNYRGFAGSGGRPSERALKRDALLIYDTVVERLKPPGVLLFGRSIGCGVAVYLASERNAETLVLVSPYRSLVHLGRRYYSWVPVGLLLKHRFDSLTLAPELGMPALFVAGGSDSIIPPDESTALREAWGGPSELAVIAGADHNDIQAYPQYWEAIQGFLKARRQ